MLLAAVVLFSPWGTPGARMATRANIRLTEDIARMQAYLDAIGDTLSVLATREAEFRAIAGIRTLDSARVVTNASMAPPLTIERASMDPRPRPFAQFFGNRNERAERPDPDELLQRANELSVAFAAVSDSMADRIEKLRNTPSIMPTVGWLTGAFSRARLHPITNELRPHEGIDVSAPAGTPIVAPAGGIVIKVANEGGYGNILEIDHGNGIRTRYAHCARIIVRAGQRVDRGQMIATVGNTGLSVGPHLHYEISVDGKNVDPLKYVLPD